LIRMLSKLTAVVFGCAGWCREFFYIQMEKYSRQALAEGVKTVTDLVVTADCELFRVLVLHYNRNNQIEVVGHSRTFFHISTQPFTFRGTVK